MKSLKINSIGINGIGPILDLHLEFNTHFNIICGANGVGKTTILDCVSQAFAYNDLSVRCNVNVKKGSWTVNFDFGEKRGDELSRSTDVQYLHTGVHGVDLCIQANSLFVFKANRFMPYTEVRSIDKDPEFNAHQKDRLVARGVNYEDIKKWLVNRFLWSHVPGNLNEVERDNLTKAKECFGEINPEFSFKTVNSETNDVLVKTPLGEIELEQLSSGYIAMIVVLLGIIKEIEYRFKDPQTKKPLVKVQDFTGVIILDELDVHLHPTMQAQMYLALKKLLPNAQVITSTHSPHVIQVAKPSEIIPLVRKDGKVCVNPLVNREYGCQGWTVEEILGDVMNMQETRTFEYHQAMNDFNEGLRADDGAKVRVAYNKLNLMLHPDNVLRQVLEIKMIGVGNDQD